MARIYVAHRRRDHRRVAIKIFQPGPGQETRFRDCMLHEANALEAAANPLVVELLEFGMCSGRPFLVLEWLEGRSLGDMIGADAPLSIRRVASVFHQILDAVEALHVRGVIHADLKPDNAMLVPHADGERLRLIDLGAAGVRGAAVARRHEVFGTPGYIAPEIVDGEPLEPSTDVYAAGVLLFELLTGSPPFPGTVRAGGWRSMAGRAPWSPPRTRWSSLHAR